MQRGKTLPKPDKAFLRDIALRHVARFATTERRLGDILRRRVARWAAQASRDDADVMSYDAAIEAFEADINHIIREMVQSGALNDLDYGLARARALLRSGHSSRHAFAWLQSRGVSKDDAARALHALTGADQDAAAQERAAALIFARKKRLGPYSSTRNEAAAEQAKAHQRNLARFARAGFTQEMALKTLQTSIEEAEDVLYRMRHS